MYDLFNKIDEKRLIQTFVRLVKIDSISYHEEKIIKYLVPTLREYGLKVKVQKVKNTGNIIALLKGNKKGQALFFNAHVDTVEPGKGIKPVVTEKLIKSDGKTILGGDDKAAVALFLEGIQYLKKFNIKHPDIYFILTCAEEHGLIGAKNMDFSLVKAKYGFSFDADGKPGTAVVAAPTHYQYTITVFGKAAHAGVEPEKGINAIKIGSELIRRIKTGKLDYETTANVGKIEGGIATNIVPDRVIIEGEVRSRNEQKLKRYLKNLTQIIVSIKKDYKVRIKFDLEKAYKAYNFTKNAMLVEKLAEACKYIKIKPYLEKSNGGSDCNIFNQKKFQCLNLGIGMSKVHSKKEFILIKDLVNGLKLFLSLIVNW